ncbi:MAG: helix-turn-helix domain-containing protein [Nitrospirota bacterium]
MESLGQYLRGQRNTRGVSLEEVSTRTRIRLRTLEALERDDYTSLPAEVTVKGFLRSYVRCLGLNEQDVMARYQQFAAEYFQVSHEAEAVKGVVEPDRHHVLQQRLTLAGLGTAGVMIVVSAVVLWSPRATPEHPTAITSPLSSPPPVLVVPRVEDPVSDQPLVPSPQAPTGTDGVAISSPPPAEPAKPQPADAATVQRVVITANEPSWVQAFIDDTELKEALMQAGERVEWSAQQHVRLTVGNAGGVSVEFNGEPVPSLGANGKVRTVVLPRGAVSAAPPMPKHVATVPPSDTPMQLNPDPPALTSPADSTTVPTQSF